MEAIMTYFVVWFHEANSYALKERLFPYSVSVVAMTGLYEFLCKSEKCCEHVINPSFTTLFSNVVHVDAHGSRYFNVMKGSQSKSTASHKFLWASLNSPYINPSYPFPSCLRFNPASLCLGGINLKNMRMCKSCLHVCIRQAVYHRWCVSRREEICAV